jgi:hypothetical protein
MVQALSGRTIDWRGTDLGGQWRTRGGLGRSDDRDEAPEEPVLGKMDAAPDIATIKLPEYIDSTTATRVEQSILGELQPGGA